MNRAGLGCKRGGAAPYTAWLDWACLGKRRWRVRGERFSYKSLERECDHKT